jgi:hypothetical protein
MVRRNIQPEDLSKEQLCKLVREVTLHNFVLQSALEKIKLLSAPREQGGISISNLIQIHEIARQETGGK